MSDCQWKCFGWWCSRNCQCCVHGWYFRSVFDVRGRGNTILASWWVWWVWSGIAVALAVAVADDDDTAPGFFSFYSTLQWLCLCVPMMPTVIGCASAIPIAHKSYGKPLITNNSNIPMWIYYNRFVFLYFGRRWDTFKCFIYWNTFLFVPVLLWVSLARFVVVAMCVQA